MSGQQAHFRDTLDYEMRDDGAEEMRTYTYSKGDTWRRTMLKRTGRRTRFRYHVRIGVWVRVPWIAWAMFA